ncbi:hypothetical protein T4C_2018, partial [Trichinella pseudospiralis]
LTYVASGSVAKRFPKAFHIFTCITIIENGAHLYGKVNEEEKGENADDTKPIFRVHLEEQEMRRAREGSNALKTGFWRCIMQITIAIKVPYHQYGSEENNCENPDDRKWIADDTKQIADGAKQINRTQEVCGSPWVPIL